MSDQYWADGSTKNCVWLFQTKQKSYGENGCTCEAFDEEGEEIEGKECTCFVESWRTEGVFLTKREAKEFGEARPYAYGEYEKGWRIWGVQAHGLMVEFLGKHNKEFEEEVEYISHPRKRFEMVKNKEVKQVFDIKNVHRARLVDGFEAPLFVNGKDTGNKVRVMSVMEDDS